MYTVEKLPSPINLPKRKSFAERLIGRELLFADTLAAFVRCAANGFVVVRSGDCCAPLGDSCCSFVGCSTESLVVTVESAMADSSALFTSVLDSIALVDDEHVASLTEIACDLVISVIVDTVVFVATIGNVFSSPEVCIVLVSELILFDCCDLHMDNIYREKRQKTQLNT